MFCKKCGKEIAEDSKFCRHCGFVFNTENNSQKGKIALLAEKVSSAQVSLKSILLFIAIGIWILVLQNLGIIPISQDVNIVKQERKVDVYVKGGSVDVDNTVDVIVNDF